MLLSVTSFFFWHFFIGFELYSIARRELEKFQNIASIQINQFISDNETHLKLYDYERIRVNTIRMKFPYEIEQLAVIGPYGEPIYERKAKPKDAPTIFKFSDPEGFFSLTRDLSFYYTFSSPFHKEVRGSAAITGTLNLTVLLQRIIRQFILWYCLGIIFYLAQLVLITICVRWITGPLSRFTKGLRQGRAHIDEFKSEQVRFLEIKEFIEAYEHKTKSELRLREELLKNENEINLGKLAAQVAHDIRSPLAALNMVLDHLADIPEDTRVLIRTAVHRIKDIANSLVKKNTLETTVPQSRHVLKPYSKQHLWSLVEPIVIEKQLVFETDPISIRMHEGPECYEIFSEIDAVEFRRILSNLIHNSVEALSDKGGGIDVSIGSEGANAWLSVKDNGKGIPKKILPELAKRGFTFGKSQGSGLGLYHAKTCLEKWNGQLEVSSTEGVGTEVKLTFPKCHPPSWFVPKLQVSSGVHWIVLDDDPSVHQVWKRRLSLGMLQKSSHFQSHHFMTAAHLREWLKEGKVDPAKAVFLIDYELNDEKTNGIEVIQSLNSPRQSFLVTSRSDEDWIRKQCERYQIRLIPKALVRTLPIEVSISSGGVECIN